MIDNEIPFVLVNNYQEGAASIYAKPDNGMQKAIAHATSLGHSSITYITGDLRFKNGKDRLAVFEEQASLNHIHAHIIEGDFSRKSGFESFEKMQQRPSLVMTASDRQAFGFMQACMEQGLHVPRDISVIGYDNFQPAGTSAPPLTTVDHPVTEMGIIAAEMAIDMIQKKNTPEQKWLDTGFVIRKSTTECRH
jgi:DNA-binding LacI/PurR family transcriptional regulator